MEKVKIFLCYLFLTICILVILLQALHPAWYPHLITDLFVFKERAIGNFINNEYQPGALLFFKILSFFVSNQSLDAFTISLFKANILLIFLTALLIQKITRPINIIILGIIILFIGPILLFRFELLVVFLVIASFYFFKRNLLYISSVFLSLAVLVKVYPLIYLPFFLISLYKQGGIKKSINFISIFIAFSSIFLFFFMYLYNFNFIQLFDSLKYHSLKPVGLEGSWSAIISLIHLATTGTLPEIVAAYVTWGISSKDLILPMWFFNNFWLLILGLFHLAYIKRIVQKEMGEIFLIIITLSTILFSKLSSPQYLIWFIFLLPLINFKKYISNMKLALILIISLISAFLTQYIYPLNYSEFLSLFSKGGSILIFYFFIAKNLSLLIIFYLFLTLKDE